MADDVSKPDEGPRTYSLHKSASTYPSPKAPCINRMIRNFYQMRIDRLRNIQQAKRNQERLMDPTLFPSIPKNDLT